MIGSKSNVNSPLTKIGCRLVRGHPTRKLVADVLGRQRERQADMSVSWAEMPRSPGHGLSCNEFCHPRHTNSARARPFRKQAPPRL